MKHIFPVFRKVWNESEGDWLETEEILGYEALDNKSNIIAKAETPDEIESILVSSFLEESNPDNLNKIKLDPKLFKRRMAQKC